MPWKPIRLQLVVAEVRNQKSVKYQSKNTEYNQSQTQ